MSTLRVAARLMERMATASGVMADNMERARTASGGLPGMRGAGDSRAGTGGASTDRGAGSSSGGTGSGSAGPVALRETNWWLERLFRLQLEANSQAKLGNRTPGNSYRRASR